MSASTSRVDFLYKQDKANPEEFLLGKKIEKTQHLNTYSGGPVKDTAGGVESFNRESVRTELNQVAVGGTMSMEEIEAQRMAIDMSAKMRDDPLFQIRKREEEDKREMLKNPLKMKRLQEKLTFLSKRNVSSAADDNGEEDDNNLLHQYLKILQKKNQEKAMKATEMVFCFLTTVSFANLCFLSSRIKKSIT